MFVASFLYFLILELAEQTGEADWSARQMSGCKAISIGQTENLSIYFFLLYIGCVWI